MMRGTPAKRRSRTQRGSVFARGAYWWGRYRGEPAAPGERRPELRVRIGLRTIFRTEAAARIELHRRIELLGASIRPHGRRARFADYLPAYQAARIAILRPSSRATLTTHARTLERELGRVWLDQVDLGTVQARIARLHERKLSRSTIVSAVALLRRVLKTARTEGIAAIAIAPRELAFPKTNNAQKTPRTFTIDETRLVLANAQFPWLALYAVCAYSGLRIGEALGLAWDSIDFDRQTITVRQQSSHGRLAQLKSRNSATAIPLAPQLAAILTDYRKTWRTNELGLLFASKRGRPLWASGVRRRHLAPLLKRLAIEPAGFHAWRHALATTAFRAGVGAAAVRQLLRHGSIAVTLKYCRVDFDDLRRGSIAAAALIDSPISRNPACGTTASASQAITDDSQPVV